MKKYHIFVFMLTTASIILTMIDVTTTSIALTTFHGVESNPIIMRFIQLLGLDTTMFLSFFIRVLMTGIGATIVFRVQSNPGIHVIVFIMLYGTIVTLVVVINNLAVLTS